MKKILFVLVSLFLVLMSVSFVSAAIGDHCNTGCPDPCEECNVLMMKCVATPYVPCEDNDGTVCTKGVCGNYNNCVSVPDYDMNGQDCESDQPKNPTDWICTLDQCIDGICGHFGDVSLEGDDCGGNNGGDDGNDCTKDLCNQYGKCVHDQYYGATHGCVPTEEDCAREGLFFLGKGDPNDCCSDSGFCSGVTGSPEGRQCEIHFPPENTLCGVQPSETCLERRCDEGSCLPTGSVREGNLCGKGYNTGNDCTVEKCELGACTEMNIEEGTICCGEYCSITDEECQGCECEGSDCNIINVPDFTTCTEDGDACTIDQCKSGGCTHDTPTSVCRSCQEACEAAYPPLKDKIVGICRPEGDDCSGYTSGDPLDPFFYQGFSDCEDNCCCMIKNTCMDFCKEKGYSSQQECKDIPYEFGVCMEKEQEEWCSVRSVGECFDAREKLLTDCDLETQKCCCHGEAKEPTGYGGEYPLANTILAVSRHIRRNKMSKVATSVNCNNCESSATVTLDPIDSSDSSVLGSIISFFKRIFGITGSSVSSITKGRVPTKAEWTSSDPFYTEGNNPRTSADDACLGDLQNDVPCVTEWEINTTGPVCTTYDFFATYNITHEGGFDCWGWDCRYDVAACPPDEYPTYVYEYTAEECDCALSGGSPAAICCAPCPREKESNIIVTDVKAVTIIDEEVCDGVDNDCDGVIDDNIAAIPSECGVGACASTGEITCVDGANVDSCTPGAPTAEICDGVDNDCDGVIDNGGLALCDDGIGCNGRESCIGGSCQPGVPNDCSVNDLYPIETCLSDSDNNSYTWDVSAGFTSTCQEPEGTCTVGDYIFTHTCDVARCGAECDAASTLVDKCIDEVWHHSGSCDLSSCTAVYQTEDCSVNVDGWFNSSDPYWVDTAPCERELRQDQEYRSYICSDVVGCMYLRTDNRTVVLQIEVGDSDGDGICDADDNCPSVSNPSQLDSDLDGVGDACDDDDDGDGITDIVEGTGDADADGIPNSLDSDSDNDGVPDSTEGSDANSDGVPDVTPSGVDEDGDGLDDAFDADQGGTSAAVQDTDLDGVADYIDTDDDGDEIPTIEEGTGDDDGDGIPNYLDNDLVGDSDGDGVPDDVDKCPDSGEWYASIGLRPNHYDSSNLDLTLTFGCDLNQILYCKPGNNAGEYKFGLTEGTLNVWTSQSGWSTDCQVNGVVVNEGEAKAFLEDTDNAGFPDIIDGDNDNDGIPDSEDSEDDSAGVNGLPGSGKPDWWCESHPNKC